MTKIIDKKWAIRPWCLNHDEKYINGECPYDILVDFMEQIEEFESETDGSKVDKKKLDSIYQKAIKRFREVSPKATKGTV